MPSPHYQDNLFGDEREYKIQRLDNKSLIKTISYSQTEILSWIIRLHCPNGFDLDPTYSKGNFYKGGIPQPKYKFDITPSMPEVIKADVRNLPLNSFSIKSIIFDPPFIVSMHTDKGKTGIIRDRFGSYKTITELWLMYWQAMEEFKRILKDQGVLIFKCQDTVDSGQQYFTHNIIFNYAKKLDFYPKDLFVLLAENRIIGKFHHKQQHARKFHSYFWVFINNA